MFLKIVNFRSLSNLTLEIEKEECFVLFKGNSGSGKSTIFEAILWLFFGRKNKSKLTDGNKSRTEVSLENEEFSFLRSTRPQYLELKIFKAKKIFKGEEAQEHINKIFFSRDVFLNFSYSRQNSYHVLFEGNTKEKFSFIESFAFKEDKTPLLLIEFLEDKSKEITNKANNLEENYKIKKDLISDKDFSLYLDKDQRKELAEEIKILTLKLSIQKKLKEIQELKSSLVEINFNLDELYALKNFFENGNSYQDLLLDVHDIPEDITSLIKKENNRKIQAKKYETIIALAKSIFKEDILLKEKEDVEKLKRKITCYIERKKLFKEYQHLLKLKKVIDESKITEVNYEHMKEELDEIRELIKIKENNEILICPICDSKLIKKETNKLELFTSSIPKEDIKILKQKESFLKKRLEELRKIEINNEVIKRKKEETEKIFSWERFIFLDEFFSNNSNEEYLDKEEIYKLKSCLEEFDFDSYAINKIDIKKLEKLSAIKKLKQKISYDLIIEAYNKEYSLEDIKSLIEKKLEMENIKKKINSLLKEVNEKEISFLIKDKKELKDFKDLKDFNKNEILDSIKRKEKIIRQSEILDPFFEIKLEVEKLEKELNLIKFEETNILKIISLAKKTYHEILNETVKEINLYLEEEMEALFSNNLKLEFAIEDNKIKEEIFSKDKNAYFNYGELSGGEKNRINLALFLALNNVRKGRILFLDEILSSLDLDNKINAIKRIKKIVEEKENFICILSMHEGIESGFDKIIDIEKLE